MRKDLSQEIQATTQSFYYKVILQQFEKQSHMDEFIYGKITGYKNKVVTKYLKVPKLVLEKHFDDDYEFGTGEFIGWLIKVEWVETKIPIGKETVKVAIRKKPKKGQTVKFTRYQPLETVKDST